MTKKLFLVAVTFLCSILLTAQKLTVEVNYVTSDGSAGNNIIYYQPEQLLTWYDFKGKPLTGMDAAALTSAGFGVKLQFRRIGNVSKLAISVSCSFSKQDSWVLPVNKTPYILNHEQKHFDIAYIHTILFIQKLKNAVFTNASYGAVIQKIYNETALSMRKIQNQYDGETSHSRIPAKQAEWDEKISQQLSLPARDETYRN